MGLEFTEFSESNKTSWDVERLRDFFWGLEVSAEADDGEIEDVVGDVVVSFVSTDKASGILSSEVEADGTATEDLEGFSGVVDDWLGSSNFGFLARLGPGSSAGGEDDDELTDDSRLFFFRFFIDSLKNNVFFKN